MNKSLIQAALASLLAPVFGSAQGQLTENLARGAVPFATYNYQGAVLGGTAGGPTYNPMPFTVAEVKFDMVAIAAARVAASQAAIAATDVLQALGVKAGTWVPMVALQTVTAEGAAATADIGDGTDTDGFIDDANLNSAGFYSSLITTAFSVATAGGKIYTADDTLDVLVNSNGVDVAVFHLFVPMVDLRKLR